MKSARNVTLLIIFLAFRAACALGDGAVDAADLAAWTERLRRLPS